MPTAYIWDALPGNYLKASARCRCSHAAFGVPLAPNGFLQGYLPCLVHPAARLIAANANVRLNAACRARGISYNTFIPALIAAGIELNRKMLSELAIIDPEAFDAIVELARPHLVKPAKKTAAATA
jgi:hypothetical protein